MMLVQDSLEFQVFFPVLFVPVTFPRVQLNPLITMTMEIRNACEMSVNLYRLNDATSEKSQLQLAQGVADVWNSLNFLRI
jgi:hypothetical protein